MTSWTIPNIKVLKVEERKTGFWKGGIGSESVFKEKSLGYFALFEGSYESIFLGHDKPDLLADDLVTITIIRHERIQAS